MAEQTQGSIKDRIAALNLDKTHHAALNARPTYPFEQGPALKKRPPPPPPRPQVPQRQQTVNNPPIYSNAPTSSRHLGNQPNDEAPPPPKLSPALPPRPPPRSSAKQSPALPARSSPALPPRKVSAHSMSRRDSNESISTIASGISAYSLGSAASNGDQLYTIRAPAYDPAKLPALPPKTKTTEAPKKESATLRAMRSTSSDRPDKRLLPPVLPSRPTAPLPPRRDSKAQESLRPQRSQVFPSPRVSALSLGMNKSTEIPPPIPGRSFSTGNSVSGTGAPPPIPLGSRPNLSALMASKPKPGSTGSCLKCRDFSGPDSHASRFPRETVPSSDVGWLSIQLTSPFPSATDKARAIFTWLHHNIDYDVHSFFGGTVTGTTPERVIRTGLAVCQGFADLFCALALKAGLECMVISGDGKGFGHKALKPGEPIPPFSSNHAWNVVRIDNNEWKLVDPCWGAGNVGGMNQPYNKSFSPSHFTMDNDEFGLKHFPSDNAHFFRADGRPSITWEEYMTNDMAERPTIYSNATPDHGLGERTFLPAVKHIKVFDPQANPDVRFQFAFVCPHWDNVRLGKGTPYVMVLHVGGLDGRKSEWVPFNTDGKVWWLDVDRTQLGVPGQKVSVFAVNSFDNKDARGLTYKEYKEKKTRKAQGFDGIAMWELV